MKAGETKFGWMQTRYQEVSEYHCGTCKEVFQFASDKHDTERAPVCCPMCGRLDARQLRKPDAKALADFERARASLLQSE